MFLHKIVLNPRSREARRDLADPYEMHSTLSRAFVPPEQPLPAGCMLWRLETARTDATRPALLIQTGDIVPEWDLLVRMQWLEREPEPPKDLSAGLAGLKAGTLFRFRLRANPSLCRQGKRLAIRERAGQEDWLRRVAGANGFSLPPSASRQSDGEAGGGNVSVSQEAILTGRRRKGGEAIRILSVLFDGVLRVESPEVFLPALAKGIGRGKSMGLGLLSLGRMGGCQP